MHLYGAVGANESKSGYSHPLAVEVASGTCGAEQIFAEYERGGTSGRVDQLVPKLPRSASGGRRVAVHEVEPARERQRSGF